MDVLAVATAAIAPGTLQVAQARQVWTSCRSTTFAELKLRLEGWGTRWLAVFDNITN